VIPFSQVILAQSRLGTLKSKLKLKRLPIERAALISEIGELFFSSAPYDSLGNASYNAATNVQQTLTVNKGNQRR
jgi:hypothetical protein